MHKEDLHARERVVVRGTRKTLAAQRKKGNAAAAYVAVLDELLAKLGNAHLGGGRVLDKLLALGDEHRLTPLQILRTRCVI